MSNQNKGTLFFVGLMTGSMVGVGLALLLTPQSGGKIRSQIRNKSLELKEEIAKGFSEASQQAQEQTAVWQEKGQEMLEKGKRKVADTVNRAEDSQA